MHGTPLLTEQTRRVVDRYDSALKKIASMTQENRALREQLREKDVKAMALVAHYQEEIELQTNLASTLKNELYLKEQEQDRRKRNVCDKSTWIDDGDLEMKESELQYKICMLQNEIQSLKGSQVKQKEEFERKALVNQANVKQSFEEEVDAIRQLASNAVCDEVREALADTVLDNERLTRQFQMMLHQMERLQMTRERKDKELLRARREIEFRNYRDKLRSKQRQRNASIEDTDKETARQHDHSKIHNEDNKTESGNQFVVDDAGESEFVKNLSNGPACIEQYFMQCLKNSKNNSNY